MSEDSYTEVTSQSWFSRIGDSIKGILVGLVLFGAAFPMILWNENRAIDTAKGLEEGAGAVVSVAASPLDPQNEGKLVHINADAKTDAVLVDSDFGIKVTALQLVRKVEMYQWEESKESETEKKLGGGTETKTTYSYRKVWADHPLDSSGFKQSEEHRNPGRFPYESQQQIADPVTLGDYVLPSFLVGRLDKLTAVNLAEQSLTLPGQQVQPAVEGPKKKNKKAKTIPETETIEPKAQTGYQVFGQEIYSASPNDPQIGDIRISFSMVSPGPVSLVARQVGKTFEPYQTHTDTTIEMIQSGTQSAANMFKQAEEANTMLTWILRGVAFFMMFLGLSMVLKPISVLGDVVPIIGSILGVGTGLIAGLLALALTLITVAIAWIAVRPMLSAVLVVGGIAALFGMKKLRRKPAGQPASAAAT